MVRYMHNDEPLGGTYMREYQPTLQSIADDIRDEEQVRKRALMYADKQEGRVYIKRRSLFPGRCKHHMRVTQGQTRWYPEHSAFGTEYYATCRLCGAVEDWIYGEANARDTGGLNNG